MSDESMPLVKVNAERAATDEHIATLERRYEQVGTLPANSTLRELLHYDAQYIDSHCVCLVPLVACLACISCGPVHVVARQELSSRSDRLPL